MNREELIEEAAKALFVGGDGLDSSPETRAIWEPRIRAALAVFEQARTPKVIERHDLVMPICEDTPTDDEREALALLLAKLREARHPEGLDAWSSDGIAHAILAAGFRRTVQGEPTDAQVSQAKDAVSRIAGLRMLRRYTSFTDGWWSDLYSGIARAALRADAATGDETTDGENGNER